MHHPRIPSKKILVFFLATVAIILSAIALTLVRSSSQRSLERNSAFVIGVDQPGSDERKRLTDYELLKRNGQREVLFSLPVDQQPSNIIKGNIVAFEEVGDELSFFRMDLTRDVIRREALFRLPEQLVNMGRESIALLTDGRVIVSITERSDGNRSDPRESGVPWRMYLYSPSSGVQKVTSSSLPFFTERQWIGVNGENAFFLQRFTEECITNIGIINTVSGEEAWIVESSQGQPICASASELAVDRQWVSLLNRSASSPLMPIGWSVFDMETQTFTAVRTPVNDPSTLGSAVWDDATRRVVVWLPDTEDEEKTTMGTLVNFDPEAGEAQQERITIPLGSASLVWKNDSTMIHRGVVQTDDSNMPTFTHILILDDGHRTEELLQSDGMLTFIGMIY